MKSMTLIRRLLALFVIVGFLIPGSSRAATDTPAEQVVRHFYTQLIGAMKQGDQLGFSGRYKKLDPAIRSAFDLPLMARLAVGSSWTLATPQEQAELVNAFSEFSVATYASRFAAYDGEKFTVIDQHQAPDGVIVETSLQPKDGDPVALDYFLRMDDKGEYRITDVFLNGTISELATRRAEFSSIARRDGIPALVNSLDEKSKQMGPS
jgi:phospholipid transport system substrate-binding protein